MNILFVNYGDFSTNSLNHIAPFANFLTEQGHHCIVCAPANLQSRFLVPKILFQTTSYSDILSLPQHFPDGRPADIIHAWTPRINVASFVTQYSHQYGYGHRLVIHMEDHEEEILESFYNTPIEKLKSEGPPESLNSWHPMLSHPIQYKSFLESGDAHTAVINSLFQLQPDKKPKIELLPGLEHESKTIHSNTPTDGETIVYSGGVTSNNIADIANLYNAIGSLRQNGRNIKILKTGPNHPSLNEICNYDTTKFVTDLGFLAKPKLLSLLAQATVLIQPGKDTAFNRFRLPSKLPEFLASGTPVITGDTNLGKRLSHRKEAYLLQSSTPEEICEAYLEIIQNQSLYKTLAHEGKRFAKENFDLEQNGAKLLTFYRELKNKQQNESRFISIPNCIKFNNYQAEKESRYSKIVKNAKNILLRKRIHKTRATYETGESDSLPNSDTLIKNPEQKSDSEIIECDNAEISKKAASISKFIEKQKETPLISIVLPTFSPDIKLIEESIESVIKQYYENWELIIVDDGSKSFELTTSLNRIKKGRSRVRCFFLETNSHIAAATNFGISKSRGDYIGFLDHDDLLSPYALAFAAYQILKNPTTNIIYTNEDKINKKNRRKLPYVKPDWDPLFIQCQNFVGHFSVFKTSLIQKVGGLNPKSSGAQDWDLLLRASKICDPRTICHIPHLLYHWRETANSTSVTIDNKSYAYQKAQQTIETHLKATGYHFTLRQHRGAYFQPHYQKNHCSNVTLILESSPKQEVSHLPHAPFWLSILQNQNQGIESDNESPSLGQIRNLSIQRSDTEFICIAKAGISASDYRWLEELLAFASQIPIGAASARVIDKTKKTHSCGFEDAGNGLFISRFQDLTEESDGYYHRALLSSIFPAVSLDCAVFRKAVWSEVGGFSESIKNRESIDIEYCQRLSANGFKASYLPFITVNSIINHTLRPGVIKRSKD